MMPFQPGQSGNPSGRPKMPKAEREAWEALSKRALSRLMEIIDEPEISKQVAIKIAEIATNRAYGTPAQSIDLTGKDGEELFKAFSDINESEVYAKAGIEKPKL